MEKKSVIIIGGGVSGLAAAALLGASGMRVTLFEKNNVLGGRFMAFQEEGYTFDMGPTWYAVPDVFVRFFARFNKKPEDYFALKQLNPLFRTYWSDSTAPFDVPAGFEQLVAACESIDPGIGPRLYAFISEAKNRYEVVRDRYLYSSYDTKGLEFVKHYLSDNRALGLKNSLIDVLSTITTHPKLLNVFSYPVFFYGATPSVLPALYTFLYYTDFGQGVFYPVGGMRKCVAALESLCQDKGVTINLNAPVKSVIVESGKTHHVQTEKQHATADYLVSTIDYDAFQKLMLQKKEPFFSDGNLKKPAVQTSVVTLYLGLRGTLPGIAHHTCYFSESWQEQCAALEGRGSFPQDFSFLIECPSRSDLSVTPPDGEVMKVTIPVPATNLFSQEELSAMGDAAIEVVSRMISTDIKSRIVVRRVVSPSQMNTILSSQNAWGPAITVDRHTYSLPKRIHGTLAHIGSSFHPGPGIPFVLAGALSVADYILSSVSIQNNHTQMKSQ